MTERYISENTQTEQQLADAARNWLIYLYSEEADEQGRARFSAWLDASPAHAAAYARAEQLWRDIASIENIDANVIADPKSARVGSRLAGSPAELPAWWMSWFGHRGFSVASLLLVAGIWWGINYTSVETQQYATGTGVDKQQTVLLADGSQVTLDASSTITSHFSGSRRDVELLRGSAYFDVVSDKDRAFTVTVAGNEVRVLGTAFDVRRRAGDIQISVTEGAIQVLPGEELKPAERPVKTVLKLAAGQQVTATLDGKIGEITGFNAEKTLAWRDGRLVYDNARLSDVVADINRYRLKKVELADESLGDIRITTAFSIDQSNQVLTGLEATTPVIIEDQGFRVVVRSRSSNSRN